MKAKDIILEQLQGLAFFGIERKRQFFNPHTPVDDEAKGAADWYSIQRKDLAEFVMHKITEIASVEEARRCTVDFGTVMVDYHRRMTRTQEDAWNWLGEVYNSNNYDNYDLTGYRLANDLANSGIAHCVGRFESTTDGATGVYIKWGSSIQAVFDKME